VTVGVNGPDVAVALVADVAVRGRGPSTGVPPLLQIDAGGPQTKNLTVAPESAGLPDWAFPVTVARSMTGVPTRTVVLLGVVTRVGTGVTGVKLMVTCGVVLGLATVETLFALVVAKLEPPPPPPPVSFPVPPPPPPQKPAPPPPPPDGDPKLPPPPPTPGDPFAPAVPPPLPPPPVPPVVQVPPPPPPAPLTVVPGSPGLQ
jgi:hypothetical protein